MSQTEIQNYLGTTSPLSNLQAKNNSLLKDIHNSLQAKMTLMSDQPKNYNNPKIKKKGKCQVNKKGGQEATTLQQFSQLKANSIIYNLPELTPPQINFQVSNLLRSRINQIKSDIVTKFPNIKSSQYSSNKLQNIFSRRTVLKDLQDWLQQKLKNPPLTLEDSIEYKNMIMGVGMKEVIRLIGTRCNQQANIVNQIWELTWSICRQIILYLSKRAHRCQKILQEETSFFRLGCEKRMNQNSLLLKQLKSQNATLKERCEKLSKDLAKMRKKHKQLRLVHLNLSNVNTQLRDQFEVAFKQNILLHLKAQPSNMEYKKIAKQRYINAVQKCNIKNKQFEEHMRKIMKQTSIDLQNEDVGMMELAIDINQFKLQEENRRLKVEQQLLDMFKTKQISTQTLCIEKISQFIQTYTKQFNQLGVETQRKVYQQHEVNTDQPIPTISNTKLKIKKDKQKDKKPKKEILKKDEGKSKKLTKKLTLETVVAKQSQNQEEEQAEDKIEDKNFDSESKYEAEKSSICGQYFDNKQDIKISKQQMLIKEIDNKIKVNIIHQRQIQIYQNSDSKTMRQYTKESNQQKQINIEINQINSKTQKIVSLCNKQQKGSDTNIKTNISNQFLNQDSKKKEYNQKSTSQKIQINDTISVQNEEKLQQKQKQIQKLRVHISETESKYENKMQSFKIQILSKNKTIIQLNSQINQLKQQIIKANKQQQFNNIKQQKNQGKQTLNKNQSAVLNQQQKQMKQGDKYLIDLIKQQKYGQIYSILGKKVIKQNKPISKVSMKTIMPKQNVKYIDTVEQQSEIQGYIDKQRKSTKQMPKNLSTERLSYQYNKKNITIVEERKKSSVHSRDVEFVRNSIQETDQERENSSKGSPENKKMSRRSSNTSTVQISNLNINQFILKRKKHHDDQIKAHSQLNLSFVELCAKQFYMYYSAEGIGKTGKQNGLSESCKRMFRQQYRQIYKQILQGNYGQKSEKQMRMVIQKATNNLIKQLCKDVVAAQKQGLQRIQELKLSYTTLPIMLINRFNRNYGVKKVASKNIKDLLISLKGVKKYTDKYTILSYFMLNSSSVTAHNLLLQYIDSELFFIYILFMTLIDGLISNIQIDEQQIVSISMVAKKHLTSHPQFINELSKLPQQMRNQKNSTFNNFFHKFVNMYKNLYQQRANQLQFIYQGLSTKTKQGKDGILFQDFIQFLSVFNIKQSNQYNNNSQTWLSKVIKCISQVIHQQKIHVQNVTITRDCFIKFLVKCPEFNLPSLFNHLSAIIKAQSLDLSQQQKQNEVLQMCAQYQLLNRIAKYIFEAESLTGDQLAFWSKFIKYYILQKNTEQTLGNLLEGVLDPRTKNVLLS